MLFCLLSENMSSARDRWHLWGSDGLLWKTKFCCLMHRPEKQRALEILHILGCYCGTLAGHYELFLRREKKTQNWNMQGMYHNNSLLHSFIWNWWINTSIWVYTSLICDVQLWPSGRHSRNFYSFAVRYITLNFMLVLSVASDHAVDKNMHVWEYCTYADQMI